MQVPTWLHSPLAWIFSAVIAVGVTITFVDNGPDHGPGTPRRTITIHVDRSASPGVQPKTLTVPKAALQVAAATDQQDAANNLRVETPPGVPLADLENAQQKADELAASDQLPIVTPDAAPQQRGCTSNFVRNYSSRRGVAPRWIVIHETVSPNLPGVRDLLGLTARENDPRTQVSWHYNIDRDGNCFYTVRESDKAWTEATANSFSIGIENVNTTHDFPFMLPAGYRKLGLVVSDAAKRWNIPLVLGSVNGCAPGRPGIISHAMLGPCGGGHVDIDSHDCPNGEPANGGPPCSHPELRRIIGYAKAARQSSAPKLTKKAKWSLRHAAVHKELKTACRRRPARSSAHCRELRARNRAYHRLLGR